MSLADAVKQAGVRPAAGAAARRAADPDRQAQGPGPAGAADAVHARRRARAEMVARPQGRGFFVVKVNKIVPGNALLQPA